MNFCKEASVNEYYQSLHKSLFLSVDTNHAVHPNYPEKLQPQHMPIMNQGCVIPFSAKQHFTSDSPGYALVKTLASQCDVPIQEFMNRNDMNGGSTISPLIASKSGIKTIDVGMPVLAMHSCRETGGVCDLFWMRKLLLEFLQKFGEIKHEILTD